jgi:hypothetical protein
MYLIYLDESGTPSEEDLGSYYLLAGLVVSERHWKTIDKEVEDIKNTYGLTEIHTRRILKRFKRHKNPRHLQILGDIYSLISRSSVTLICTGVYKPNNIGSDTELMAWAFMVERLNIIVDKSCQKDKVNEYGLLIMDEKNYQKDVRIKNNIRMMKQNTQFVKQRIDRIIEDPVFTPSHWRNLIQLSDAIVYCCKKYLEKDPFFISQFLTIQDKFAKTDNGNIMGAGLKVWT